MCFFLFINHKFYSVCHMSTTHPEYTNPDFYADLEGQILNTNTPKFFTFRHSWLFSNFLEHFLMVFFGEIAGWELEHFNRYAEKRFNSNDEIEGALDESEKALVACFLKLKLLSAPKERRIANLPIHWCQINAS